MKKLVIIIAIIVFILALNKQEKVIIPKEAIRFRVIASSNKEEDQVLKKKIVYELNKNIKSIEFSKDFETTRNNIKKEIPNFKKTIEETLEKMNEEKSYKIEYGMNYFPKKEYKNVIYEEGNYESLVITLGEGLGENFWCILFPPLCSMEKDIEESKNVEYKSIIKELIYKYIKK